MLEKFEHVFGFLPYGDVPAVSVLALCLIYLSAFFIKGAVGFGNLSIIVVFSAFVLPPHTAILIAAVTAVVSQVQYLPQAIRDGDWRITRPVLLSYFIASTIGIWIFGRMDAAWLSVVLGIALGLILAADMFEWLAWAAKRIDLHDRRVLYPVSAISGFITGLTGAGGLFFVALYVKQLAPEPRRFRGTVLQLGVILTVWRLIVLSLNGLINIQILTETVLLLPAVFIGGFIGTQCYRLISAKRFFTIIQVVLLAAACGLVWRGIASLI